MRFCSFFESVRSRLGLLVFSVQKRSFLTWIYSEKILTYQSSPVWTLSITWSILTTYLAPQCSESHTSMYFRKYLPISVEKYSYARFGWLSADLQKQRSWCLYGYNSSLKIENQTKPRISQFSMVKYFNTK